ncbi:hypothetical protein GL263_10310 [Streptomyces durbertensis]|uniref:histidine kinase n=1 Tax=Streptomyces durbertensis TaxID=2448886 RepID=A0ABR6EG64_9ACTN|nr:hypothetical protein [Streptomyces durbertensis]
MVETTAGRSAAQAGRRPGGDEEVPDGDPDDRRAHGSMVGDPPGRTARSDAPDASVPRAGSDRPVEVVGDVEGAAVGVPQSGVGSGGPLRGPSHHGEEDARPGRGGATPEGARDRTRPPAAGPNEPEDEEAGSQSRTERLGATEGLGGTDDAEPVARRGGPEVRFHLSGDPVVLPTPVEVALLRIAQSALGNALSHADASRVELTLSYMVDPGEGEVVLDVVDDGVGFVPGELPPPGSAPGGAGFGLAAMRARAHALHGTFVVESAPDQGTAVAVTFPFSVAEDSGQAVP